MATYKVIQDIEADDKLLGPLTLKQFIYFAITAVCLYLTFFAATKGAAFMAIFLLPPAAFFGMLGFPWSKAQPTEVWLLAKVRFYFKPRKRVWDQSGVKELVTVTAPKTVERQLTDGLSPYEVRSRLSALAQTIDSRGWAVKQLASAPFGGSVPPSDRLMEGTETAQGRVTSDVSLEEDMLDESNNPTAQKIEQMISQSEQKHKDQLKSRLTDHQSPTAPPNPQQAQKPPTDFWFMSQNSQSYYMPPGLTTGQGTVVAPYSENPQKSSDQPAPDEEAILEKIRKTRDQQVHRGHEKTILPPDEQKKLEEEQAAQAAAQAAQEPTQKAPDPEMLALADNDDLNVETIARVANKKKEEPPDEVVISLH